MALAIMLCAVVLITIGSLAVSVWTSQPRIDSVSGNGSRIDVEMAGSGWSLDADSVIVSPHAPISSIDQSDKGGVITLSTPLLSSTEYTVTVGDSSASFVTAPMEIVYLGSDGSSVMSRELGGSDRQIFSSPAIDEVRAVTDGVVVSYRDSGSGSFRVSFVSLRGEETVLNESLDAISTLRSNGTDRLGFTTKDAVVTMRTDGSNRVDHPVSSSWSFVPGGEQIVSVRDGLVYLSGNDIPLGGANTVSTVTTGDVAVVEKAERYRLVDLTGARPDTDIEPVDPGHLDSVEAFPGGTVHVYDEKVGGDLTLMRAYVVAQGETRMLSVTQRPGAIVQACASSNGQYVAVSGTAEVSSEYLESSTHSRPPGIVTVIYDSSTGDRVDVLEGSTPSWCASSPLWWQHPNAHVH